MARSRLSTLRHLWQLARLPDEALEQVLVSGADPVLPSSFCVGAAAQASIAAAALAACELGHQRGLERQQVSVDMHHAAHECLSWFSVNGRVPDLWDKFSGLYRCKDGWARVHANFQHHREGALKLLGLDPSHASREDAERAMLSWGAQDFEQASAEHGLVAAALRSFAQWDACEQGKAIARQPLFSIERIGDAAPIALPPLPEPLTQARPLQGLRVLDLTRILAGPVAGRALAAYGADVLLVNSPHLPNIEAIADTSRGKLSAHIDLHDQAGQQTMRNLLGQAHVFIQGYRPGGMLALGLGPQDLAKLRPGIVYVSLSAYGTQGPWANRRGFDSLVQTATGLNDAEALGAGQSQPKALPMQILDHASGYLMAMAASAAMLRQQTEGGSWLVSVSLAQTAHWLRALGRVTNGFGAPAPDPKPYVEIRPSGFGELAALRHSAVLSRTPAIWTKPSMPPGSHAPQWP